MPNYRAAARRAARRHGLDPNVFVRQIGAESSFNPRASSGKAFGIAQLTPDTARAWGVDPSDPIASLNAAAAHMAGYVRKYGGYENALRAYNAGPGAIQASKGYKETNDYVAKILRGKTPSLSSSTTTTTSGGGGLSIADPGGSVDVTALLAKMRVDARPQRTISAPHTSELLATPSLAPEGYQAPITPVASNQAPVKSAIEQLNALQDSIPQIKSTGGGTTSSSDGVKTSGHLPSGVASFEGKQVAAWIAPALDFARARGWKGTVRSGYRSRADQERIYRSGVRPAAKPGTSNHEGTEYPRGAIDVSDAQTLARILKGTKYGKRLKWAGAKDPVHFSHPHGGSY
jgi:hypothetical protein